MSKKTFFCFMGVLALCSFLSISFFSVEQAAAKKITIKAISAWPKNDDSVKDDYLAFIAHANEMFKEKFPGQIEIRYLGGPEVIPTKDQAEALRAGTVELYFGTDAYYAGIAPAANVSKLTQFFSWEERERGVNAIYDKIHREKLNATYLARLGSENSFQLYLNKEGKGPDDLAGFRIRVSPMYIDFMKALNVTPIETSPGDIYQAIERGVVDGFCWPVYSIRNWGWHEVTKYFAGPDFYKVCHPILMNLDKWNEIPEEMQTALMEVLMAEEWAAVGRDMVKLKKERNLLKKAGLTYIEFSPADSKRYYDLAYDSAWEGLLKKAPVYGPQLRNLLTK